MLQELARRLWYFLRRERLSAELAEEMRLHLEMREEALRRSGIDSTEARFAARRRFGNPTSMYQRSRDAWGLGSLDHFRQDTRYAVRRLAQRRGFALGIVTVLALGVGATTAMFSAVDAAMLRPLPFHDPERLVTLRGVQIPSRRNPGTTPEDHSTLDIIDVGEMAEVFSHVAAYATGGLNLADREQPQRVKVGVVTVDFFATLGVAPLHGRSFDDREGKPDGPAVAIVSDGLWSRHFGREEVLGRRVQLGARSFEIVGVMPPRFGFPGESDVWIPMTIPMTVATFEPFRGWLPSSVIARVAPSLAIDAADARLRDRWKQLEADLAASVPGRRFPNRERVFEEIGRLGPMAPLQQQLVGDRRLALLVLLGATGVLLLIACANVTNLLLSHATTRRREMAVREVLGATRGRLIRQLLTESLLLSVAGTVLGVALAPIALGAMSALMPAELAGVAPPGIDRRVLAFAAALALVTGIGFGLWPALGSTREAPAETIKTGGGVGATSAVGRRARWGLAVVELALTLILLVGAGLMLRSFDRLMGLDAGMDRARVGTLELSFVPGTPAATRLERIEAILQRVSVQPAIDAVGVINDLPLRGGGGLSIGVEVEGAGAGGETRFARWLMASSDYFETLGIPLLRGRRFVQTDDARGPRVAIVNATMARQYWPGIDPLGQRFRSGAPDDPPVTVVGVVGDVREGSLEGEIDPQMYFPIYGAVPDRLAIVARSRAAPSTLLRTMVAAVRAVDPTQAVYNVRMMDDVVAASVAPRRTNTVVISAFAALALLLASLGVYATISYAVAQRSRELGIRAALGATASDLVALVSREMVWVILAGLGIGLTGAWALARVMAGLLYGIDVHDVTTFTIVPIVLAAAAAMAALGPAWRARRVGLVEVLRAE